LDQMHLEVMWAHNSHRESKSCHFQVNFHIPGFHVTWTSKSHRGNQNHTISGSEASPVPQLWTLKA